MPHCSDALSLMQCNKGAMCMDERVRAVSEHLVEQIAPLVLKCGQLQMAVPCSTLHNSLSNSGPAQTHVRTRVPASRARQITRTCPPQSSGVACTRTHWSMQRCPCQLSYVKPALRAVFAWRVNVRCSGRAPAFPCLHTRGGPSRHSLISRHCLFRWQQPPHWHRWPHRGGGARQVHQRAHLQVWRGASRKWRDTCGRGERVRRSRHTLLCVGTRPGGRWWVVARMKWAPAEAGKAGLDKGWAG